MARYFDKPTQIKFWNGNEEGYLVGIAYRDEVICGCCGGIVEIADIEEWAAEDRTAPFIELGDWVDISDTIR